MKNRRKRGLMSKFYFIKPRPSANAGELAERLIALGPVESVYLTEGDCGFIVKARFTNGKEPTDVTNFISRKISNRYGKVVSHYEYRKTRSDTIPQKN